MSEFDPAAEYERAAAVLYDLVDLREDHNKAVPNCSAGALCCGPAGLNLLTKQSDPIRDLSLILTAVGEMCRMREKIAEGEAWKRDLGHQLEASGDAHEQEMREARAQIGSLQALVGELQGELTAWNDAADAIGPVGDPVIEP